MVFVGIRWKGNIRDVSLTFLVVGGMGSNWMVWGSAWQ